MQICILFQSQLHSKIIIAFTIVLSFRTLDVGTDVEENIASESHDNEYVLQLCDYIRFKQPKDIFAVIYNKTCFKHHRGVKQQIFDYI